MPWYSCCLSCVPGRNLCSWRMASALRSTLETLRAQHGARVRSSPLDLSSNLQDKPVFITGGSRQSVIWQTSLHEYSSGHHNTMRRRCFFLDELDPSSADSHAVQRVETEKNLHALLGPAAAEGAQEQQRAANRAVKASALPPGFALDERWRSTPSPTTPLPRLSQPGRAKHAWLLTRPHPWDCTCRCWLLRRWPLKHRCTHMLCAFSFAGWPGRQYPTTGQRRPGIRR